MTADTARTLPRETTATRSSALVSMVGYEDGSVSLYSDGVGRVPQPTHDRLGVLWDIPCQLMIGGSPR